MASNSHIPLVQTIDEFFRLLRFGSPTGQDISVTRVEDQPENKVTEVPLFRSNIYRVIFLIDSVVEWHLPNKRLEASQHCIYFSQPGKLESWQANLNNRGFVVCFNEEVAQGFHQGLSVGQFFPFFSFEGSSILYLTEDEADLLKTTVEAMISEAQSFRPDRKIMMKYLLFQYLIQIHRVYRQCEEELDQDVKNHSSIYNRFKRELDGYFADLASSKETTQVSVSEIASRLALSPGYLGSVIKELTGKTATAHINEKTVLEAKSYLLHTDLQMSEIAHRLGFNNLSYFTRFFKKNTSDTPKQYRKSLQIGATLS